MDSVDIAKSAVELLVPYLAKTGNKIAEKIGEDIWNSISNKVETVYKKIKIKLSGDNYHSQTLERLEERPLDQDRQNSMKSVLKEVLIEDPQFQNVLEQILVEIKNAGRDRFNQIYLYGDFANNGSAFAKNGSFAFVGDNNTLNFIDYFLKPEPMTEPTDEKIIPFDDTFFEKDFKKKL